MFASAAALLRVRGLVDPLRRLEVLLAQGAVLAVTTRRRRRHWRQPRQRRERHSVQLKRRVDVVAGVESVADVVRCRVRFVLSGSVRRLLQFFCHVMRLAFGLRLRIGVPFRSPRRPRRNRPLASPAERGLVPFEQNLRPFEAEKGRRLSAGDVNVVEAVCFAEIKNGQLFYFVYGGIEQNGCLKQVRVNYMGSVDLMYISLAKPS